VFLVYGGDKIKVASNKWARQPEIAAQSDTVASAVGVDMRNW
jgi:hypothetical protein